MTVAVLIAGALIACAAILAVIRLEKGPSMLDRAVAFDVLTVTIVAAVAVEAALTRRTESIPILVVLSLVGFVGSVAIARFAAKDSDAKTTPAPDSDLTEADRLAALEAARLIRRRGTPLEPVRGSNDTTLMHPVVGQLEEGTS